MEEVPITIVTPTSGEHLAGLSVELAASQEVNTAKGSAHIFSSSGSEESFTAYFTRKMEFLGSNQEISSSEGPVFFPRAFRKCQF